MNTQKIAYVAGPYRSDSINGVWENINRARATARALWAKGYAVICPHANSMLMDGDDIPAQQFLDGDIAIMLRCDLVVMVDDWSRSEGARGEFVAALLAGIPVYFASLQDVPTPDALPPRRFEE
jgi:hypothetical protein